MDRLEEVAKKRGVGMAIVATAWCLGKEGVVPIVGLGSTERIDQAVEACKFKLSEEEEKYLEEPYLPKQIQGMNPLHKYLHLETRFANEVCIRLLNTIIR